MPRSGYALPYVGPMPAARRRPTCLLQMFAFFVIMGVMSAAHGPFHFGHAPLKLLFWLVLIVFAFLLPNSFDDGFAKFALGGAGRPVGRSRRTREQN